MTDPYSVKGSSILSKLEYLQDVHGEEARQSVEAPLRERGLIPFLASSWYPYAVYIEVNKAIAGEVFNGDLSRLTEVGEYSAQKSLLGTYRMLAQANDYFGLLSQLAILHRRFYNEGTLTIDVPEDKSSCQILLSGAPEYAEADVHIAAGFYIKAAELTDRPGAKVAVDRRPDSIAFTVSW